MNRYEWALVVVLGLVSLMTLVFVPPVVLPSAHEGVAALTNPSVTRVVTPRASVSPTATGKLVVVKTTAAPTQTPLPTPTRTATPTATHRPTRVPSLTPSPTPTIWAFDTHPELDRYIYIDQGTQHMYIFEHGKLLRDIPCSTGAPDPDKYTPAWSGKVGQYYGTFTSFGVWADEAWYLFQSAGGILIHGLPYTEVDGKKVYQDREMLGVRPVSHGCIRIAPEDAVWFTKWNPQGVQITVSDPYLERWRNATPVPTP